MTTESRNTPNRKDCYTAIRAMLYGFNYYLPDYAMRSLLDSLEALIQQIRKEL